MPHSLASSMAVSGSALISSVTMLIFMMGFSEGRQEMTIAVKPGWAPEPLPDAPFESAGDPLAGEALVKVHAAIGQVGGNLPPLIPLVRLELHSRRGDPFTLFDASEESARGRADAGVSQAAPPRFDARAIGHGKVNPVF